MPKRKIEDVIHDLMNPGSYWFNNDLTRFILDNEKFLSSEEQLTEEQKDFARSIYDTDHAEQLLTSDKSEYSLILQNVIKRLESNGISVDDKYRNILKQMAMVMGQQFSLKKPAIIPARPGLGKTEMLIATLIEKSKMSRNYASLVVTRRVEDAVRIRDEVNKELGKAVCFVRPTFTLMTLNGRRCENGHLKNDYYQSICSNENCKIELCSAKKRNSSFRPYKIVIITSAYLSSVLDEGTLDLLMELPPDSYIDALSHEISFVLPRTELIIDENPGMIFNPLITYEILAHCMVHLKQSKFDQKYIDEFTPIIGAIAEQIGGEAQYEFVDPIDSVPKLSNEFITAWRQNPHPEYYSLPEMINGFLEGGGIRQNKNNYMDYAIGVNRYRKISSLGIGFRTIILDGTGIKDLTYNPQDFNILDVEEIRDFSRGTLHRYPLSISKNFLGNDEKEIKVQGIADEAIRVIKETEALFITYKWYADRFKKSFKAHSNIKVNHFGNLIGKNDYSTCTSIVFAGINDWGAREYISQFSAVKGNQFDLTIVQNQVTPFVDDELNEFYSTLISVGLYQDLMRSNLRVASSNEQVHIYLWTPNNQIIDHVVNWLPGIKVINESVPLELQSTRQPGVMSTEALVLLDKLKGSMSPIDLKLKPKLRTIKLCSYLGRVPLREEFKYIWSDYDITHYSRDKKHAREYLEKSK